MHLKSTLTALLLSTLSLGPVMAQTTPAMDTAKIEQLSGLKGAWQMVRSQ